MYKKILIITDNLQNQINGVVTTYTNLAKLAKSKGYELKFIDPSNFKHYSLPSYPEIKLSLPFNIKKKIKEIDPDYIHIATEGPLGFAARLYLDKQNIHYNTSYHTKLPEALKKLLGIPEFLTWKYIRWFHKHSGKVLTTTLSMRDELLNNGLKTEIIPWTRGVDREIFKPIKTNREEKIILLCVSRISKEKNLDAFCSLDYPNSRKIIVGDGPYRKHLEEKYKDVEFTGFKTGKELAKYYQMADVFVFPSTWDTFGIVMIESLACGTPVAAFPVTGPRDIIVQNVDGYLSYNLDYAISCCLKIDRNVVAKSSEKWTWESAWEIFEKNLIQLKFNN
jgi:glycosyltransferase involved in cell wall biosynthesis